MKKIVLIFTLVFLFVLTSCKISSEASTNTTSNNSNQTNFSFSPTPENKDLLSDNKLSKNQKPKIKSSNILEILNKKVDDNPQISTKELLLYGNQLIKEKGYNFSFYTCSIANAENELPAIEYSEDFTAFDYSFTSLEGKEIELQILSKSWGHPCGCYFEIPLLKASKDELIIFGNGNEFSVKHLEKYNLEYVELVSKDLKNVKRKWFQPMDIIPFGISKDGTKIYVETTYDNDNLNNSKNSLVLEIAENGTFRFVAKNDPKIISKYEYVEDFPKDPNNAYLGFLKFSDGKNEHILKVSFPCT